jgi:hypothetical protein
MMLRRSIRIPFHAERDSQSVPNFLGFNKLDFAINLTGAEIRD